MSRTTEEFSRIFKEMQWYVNHHKRSVWIVPTRDNYVLSCFKPSPESLPMGTAAVCYDTESEQCDKVVSSI